MKIRLIETMDINIDAEFERIRDLFDYDEQTRLIPIIEEFSQGNFQNAYSLADKLPYNNRAGCTEREFLPLWFLQFYQEVILGGKEYEIVEEKSDNEN